MKSRTWLTGLTTGLALTAAMTVTPAPASAADGDIAANIIGGSDATRAYPFAARLLSYYPGVGTGRCMAVLVTYRGVTGAVTAAHCVSDGTTAQPIPAKDITVQVGSTHLDELTDITPTRVEVQPGWDWGTGDDAVADIAVLVLPTGTHLTGIPLGDTASPTRRVRLLGWGKTTIDATEPPPVLQQLDTRITDPSDCAVAGITAGELCVAPDPAGGQACFGDSGAPALGRTTRGWVLLGGASRETSEDCTGPTIFTDETYWSRWIKDALTRRQPH